MATNSSTEVFVAVEGYEGIYEVSNQANVRSLDREVRTEKRTYHLKGRILRPRKTSRGYWQVSLSKDGQVTDFLLHRLVAKGFLEQPEGCNIVNHLDNDKDHNWADNLEYTTHAGNIQHAIMLNRVITRSVMRSDGKIYPKLSMVKADGFSPAHVCMCCRGKQKTHKGYRWWYLDEGGVAVAS